MAPDYLVEPLNPYLPAQALLLDSYLTIGAQDSEGFNDFEISS